MSVLHTYEAQCLKPRVTFGLCFSVASNKSRPQWLRCPPTLLFSEFPGAAFSSTSCVSLMTVHGGASVALSVVHVTEQTAATSFVCARVPLSPRCLEERECESILRSSQRERMPFDGRSVPPGRARLRHDAREAAAVRIRRADA